MQIHKCPSHSTSCSACDSLCICSLYCLILSLFLFLFLLQSPVVSEVLKEQDGRKGLIAAICAGAVNSKQMKVLLARTWSRQFVAVKSLRNSLV